MPVTTSDLVRQLLDVRVWVAFDVDEQGRVLAGTDDLGSLQLVEIGVEGSRTPLTDLPSKCTGRYLPGRRAVVVQHDNGGDEKMQLSLLDLAAPLGRPATLADLTPLVADPAHMNALQDVTAKSVVYSTNRRNDVDMDVVVRDLESGQERVVYDAGGYVAETAVSPDGRSAAVTLISVPANSSAVCVTGPAAAGDGQVTDPAEHALHEQVAWASDDALVMASNHDRDFAAVVRVSLDGTTWETLVEDPEHDLHPWLAPDGSALVVATVDDGIARLAIHEPDGALRCPVPLPDGVPSVVWAADGSRFVVTVSTPTDPGSLHLVDARTGEARLVVEGRTGIPEEVRELLVTPTTHRVTTPDGEQVPCFVYAGRPADTDDPDDPDDPALAGASVVHVHGGPESAATRMFMPVIQALALTGFTVLVPNVRGSVGYGKRWYSLDDVDRRLDSVADLAALHAWLPSLDLDPDRSALWGGSYGGYMVLAGVALQPDLWAAGVDIVGMSSLVTFLENTSAYRRAYREREYGSLEHDRELLEKASPITYLDQMRAPLFVIHGANDPRVPLSEAQQLKAAYDSKDIPCELRVYWDEGHGLAKRANRLDAYPAAIEFLRDRLTTA